MARFKLKRIHGNEYWYFIRRVDGRDKSYYVGDDQAVLDRLTRPKKSESSETESDLKIGESRRCSVQDLAAAADLQDKKRRPKKIKIKDV